LCGSRAFVDHRWLRMVESVLANYEPRYVLLRRNGHLEGAAVCALERRFEQPAIQRGAGWVLRHLPYLRCSIPIVFETGLITPPTGARSALAQQLLAVGRRLAWREHALLTTFGHLAPDNAAWPALRDGGCR